MPRSANPVPQYFDSDNKILAGGKVFYFNAGTSTPKTTYSDEGETIANPNPVILDAAGRLPNVFFTGTAKQILKDLNDVQIWERDDVGAGEQASDFNVYDLNIIYDAGDIVRFNGLFFISLQNSNQNNQPNTSLTFWTEIRFIEVYNTNIDYALGVVVQTTDGNMWKGASSPNQGNDPSVDSGTNWRASIDDDLTLDSLNVTGNSTTDSLTVTNNTTTDSLNVTNNTTTNSLTVTNNAASGSSNVTGNSTTDSLNVTNNSVMNGIDAQDTDSVLLKRNASTVYARDDIVGTVSESAGVPTGAIIESGNNANGNFVKFADGTMWCDRRLFSVASGGTVWTYPVAFVGTVPTITHSIVVTVASGTPLMSEVHAPSITQAIALIYDVAGVFAGSETIDITAKGRWY